MALPNTGILTANMIRTEFAQSGIFRLSDYYRGGSIVPNIAQNNNIPTSGKISFSNFYGATVFVPDITPNPVNWTNIVHVDESGTDYVEANSNLQTILGINTDITIAVDVYNATVIISGDVPDAFAGFSLPSQGLSWGWSPSTSNSNLGTKTFVASNNTPMQFTTSLQMGIIGESFNATGTCEVRVRNITDANTVLDTFSVLIGSQKL